ncbi:MAG: DUF456 domain-containing protein, partial [Verrucomicrobiota bacterium]
MDVFANIMEGTGYGLGVALIWLLCIVGVLLSCLSISGTWLVVVAGVIALFLGGRESFPGWVDVILFAAVSGLVELMESLAGVWGIKKRGGSNWAGFGAFIGGIAGLILGSSILPIIGSLIGMMVGSFVAAYAIEHLRMKKTDEEAARIAMGAVVARLIVVLIKVFATMGLSAWLLQKLVPSAGFITEEGTTDQGEKEYT